MWFKIILSILCAMYITTGTAEARSLHGTWQSQTPHMIAYVDKDSIRITHVFDDGDTALYWQGTFRSYITNGKSFRSKADTEALDLAIFGSTDKTKTFTYKNGRLIFRFSILGTTQKVFLSRRY